MKVTVKDIHHRVFDTLKEKIKTTNIKLKPKKKKKKGKNKKEKNKDKGHNDDPIKNETANASASSSPIYSTSASTSTSTITASPSPTASITPYTNRFSTSTILQPHQQLLLQQPQPYQPTGPFPFLRLPRELRDRIYEELLTRQDHDELWIRYSQSRKTWWDATKFCLCYRRPGQDVLSTRTPPALEVAILRTCRMVYEEASAVLYGVGRYHDHDNCRGDVDGEGRRKRRNGYQIWLDAPPLQALEFLSTRLLPSSRSSIRFLKLWMDPYLDCHHATGGLDQLPPWKLVIQRSRVRHELLNPWKALMTFLGDERCMPDLGTLCVSINAQRSWHAANVGFVDRKWQYFYRRGWMEMLVPSSRPSGNDEPEDGSGSGSGVPFRALETLLVEGRRCGFEAPVRPDELSSFHELRDDLAQATAGHFVEESARWVSYMFGAGGFDPIEVPNSMLRLSLKRSKMVRECVEVDADENAEVSVDDDDDAEPESRPVSSTSTATSPPSTPVGQRPPLRPLEEFKQKFSWEDTYMPVVCTFATSLPPRSPDNTR